MDDGDNKVKATCTGQGWFFEANGKRLGPFTLEEMDSTDFESRVASQLGVEPKEILSARLAEYEKPIGLHELTEILSATVKRDEPAKLITFLGMLLAQTDEDQYNIAFQAESSTGKSYIPLELVEYFPESERRIYAGASPTSFFHEIGQWDKERKVITVNLEGKILIFMDQPHWMLMERLRPLLSHDRKVLTYKITDKREKVGLKTKTVEIIGYPSVVFCTTKPTLEDQERTRLWLLSPETSQEKFAESLYLIAKREGNREAFWRWIEQNPRRRWLKARVEEIRRREIRNIVIPQVDGVLQRFSKRKSHLTPRDQRDFPRLLRLIKGVALLNCFSREENACQTILANDTDVEEGFTLYESIAKSNELGLSPEIYEIFERVIQPNLLQTGLDKKAIQGKYLEIYRRPLPFRRLRDEVLPTLEAAGLIIQDPDPLDKRRMLVYPTDAGDISGASTVLEKYVPENSGVNSSGTSQAQAERLPLGELIPLTGQEDITSTPQGAIVESPSKPEIGTISSIIPSPALTNDSTIGSCGEGEDPSHLTKPLPSLIHIHASDAAVASPGDLRSWRQLKSGGIRYRPIPPGERCEQCGEYPVEYELTGGPLGSSAVRRCRNCFRKGFQ